MFPAELICRRLLYAFASFRQGSGAWKILDGFLQVPLPFVLTLAQYYLMGLIVDKLLTRRTT
jgi:hypothetical protein